MKNLNTFSLFLLSLFILVPSLLLGQINNTEFQIDYNAAQIDICQETSNSEITILAKDIGLSDFEIIIGLPPGVLYEAGSVTVLSAPSGYMATEVSITDLSNPVFSIASTGGWNAGDEVIFVITRSGNCDAVDHSLNSGTFKENVTISYNDNGVPKTDSDTDPTVNSYQVNYGVLSILPVNSILSTVGTFETRDIRIRQGGLGCLANYQHYVVVGRDLATYHLYFNGSALTPTSMVPNSTTTADTLFYDINLSVAPFLSVGNGNGCFDNGEEMLFVETFTVRGCDDASSFHHSNWGCGGLVCQEAVPQDGVVNISNGIPDVSVSALSAPRFELCDTINYSVLITNAGQETSPPGGAVATDLAIIFGLGFNGSPISTPLTRTTWGSIAKNTRHWGFFELNGYPVADSALLNTTATRGSASFIPPDFYTTDPDGPGGIDDHDEDGFYDDLAPGDSITVRFKFWIKPDNPTCGKISNQYLSWEHCYFDVSWENQCGYTEPPKRVDLNYSNIISNYLNVSEFTGPLDIEDGEVFTVAFLPYFGVYGNRTPLCNGEPAMTSSSSSWNVTIDLPSGITIGPNPQPNPAHSALNPTIVQVGNQIVYTVDHYTYTQFPFQLQLDCSAGVSNPLTIPVTSNYSCTDDNGNVCWDQDVHCYELIIQSHCPNPCTGPVTIDFDAQRTTPGWTDATMSTQVDLSNPGYNLDFYYPHDTMNVSSGCIISDTALTDLFFKMTYSIAASGIDQIQLANAVVEIYDISSGGYHSFPVTNLPAPVTESTNNFSITFDLSSFNEMVSSTYLFGGDLSTPGVYSRDSIRISANYVVADDFPEITQYQMLNFSGTYYTQDAAGDLVQCDTYSDRAGFEKVQIRVANSINMAYSGCDELQALFLFAQITASDDNFPNEYRPSYRMDSFKIEIPPSLTFTDTVTMRNVLMGAVNVDASSYKLVGNDLWIFPPPGWLDNDKISTNFGRIEVGLTATCTAPTFTKIQHEWHATRYFHNPDQSVHEPNISSNNSTRLDYTPPQFSIQANNPTQSGVQEEVSWDIDVCNTTSFADVDYNWLNIENNPNVTIVTITEVVNGVENTLPYLISPDGIYVQIGAIYNNECRTVRVNAKYSDCGIQTIDVGHNWDCFEYPASLVADDPSCYILETLTITPQPAQVQMSIIDQPNVISLCSLLTYELEINSAQLADIVDPAFSILFNNAPGITVNSVSFEYPAGSGNLETLNPIVSPSSLTYDLNDHTQVLANTGISGTITSTNPNDRKVNVTIELITDCDFISGSTLQFQVAGNQPCGEPAIGDQTIVISDNLEIPQALDLYDANVSITTNALGTVCNTSSNVDIQIFITGGSTAGADSSFLYLPSGVTFDTGTFNCTASAGVFCPTYSVTTINGQEVLVMAIPPGMSSGDILDFNFEVTADSMFTQGDSIVMVNTTELSNIACGSSFCNSISAQTGYGTETLDIDFGLVAAASMSNAVSCFQENDGTATVVVSGGTAPYSYSWSNGTNNATVTGLGSGTYTVAITDAKGCVSSSSVFVSSPTDISISFTQTDLSCNGFTDGTVNSISVGGTPGYSYQWSTGATTQGISSLSTGNYMVSITDANGCLKTSMTTITEPAVLGCNMNIVDATCFGYPNGSATTTTTGGTPTYNYLWDSSANNQTTPTAVGLAAGTYDLTITDANGCLTACAVTVNQPDKLKVFVNSMDVSCIGFSDGSVVLNAVGGTGSYTYQWDAAAGGQTTSTISDLATGDYEATITDGAGCLTIIYVRIETENCDPCSLDLCAVIGTNPSSPIGTLDCDGDGVSNGSECADSTDPNNECDFLPGSVTLPVTADQSGCLNLCPDLSPIMTILPGNVAGASQVSVAVEVVEINSIDTDGSFILVRIPSDPRFVFVWDISLLSAALVPVNNSEWNYLGDNGFVHQFQYNGPNTVILAGQRASFGFIGFYDPQATDGQTTITATIVPTSGGECKLINNTDSERLVYFE